MIGAAALAELVEVQWYDAAASMVWADPSSDPRVRDLAHLAVRVLSLDAEDFGTLASGRSEVWARELASCGFPLRPRYPRRGALESLVPLYRLMLELVDVRRQRQEPQQLVVVAHLIGEYLPLLAWESTLGHAGDPQRMASSVGQRWGTDDPDCPHPSALRSTARRSLNAARGDDQGYTTYLDRFHARLGEALAMCGMNRATVGSGERPEVGGGCADPCAWAIRRPLADRRDLDARLRLAMLYRGSALVALRHHAPVGHFFGVPSWHEVDAAWAESWGKLAQQWTDGANPLAGRALPTSGGGLPGLAELVSVVAAREISGGTMLHAIGGDLVRALATA